MTPSEEKKLLLQVLQRLDVPPQSFFTAPWFLPVAWAFCVGAFVLALEMGELVHPGLLSAVFAVLGIIIGIFAFARVCARQEPVMRPHVSRESIVRRLAELEA